VSGDTPDAILFNAENTNRHTATPQLHETLDNAWQSARNVRFDLEAAVESLRYFDGAQIPKVSSPLPEGASQVSFAANLQSIPPLSARSFADLGALFRCLSVARKNCWRRREYAKALISCRLPSKTRLHSAIPQLRAALGRV
jgi:hypothetical protein